MGVAGEMKATPDLKKIELFNYQVTKVIWYLYAPERVEKFPRHPRFNDHKLH
jgi:hypothetical protein